MCSRLKMHETQIEKQNGRKWDGYMWRGIGIGVRMFWFGERLCFWSSWRRIQFLELAAAAAAVDSVNDAPYEPFIVGSCSFWTRSTHIERLRNNRMRRVGIFNASYPLHCPRKSTRSLVCLLALHLVMPTWGLY